MIREQIREDHLGLVLITDLELTVLGSDETLGPLLRVLMTSGKKERENTFR